MKLDLKASHIVYRDKTGKKVPGVTTCLGTLAKPALLDWMAAEERAGILAYVSKYDTVTFGDLRTNLPQSPEGKPLFYANQKRDKAADLGTIGHAHIEAWLKGDQLETTGIEPEMWRQALGIRERFLDWWNESGMTVVHSEHVMVSELLHIGGTADVIAKAPDGTLELWDIKSSKPYYDGRPYDEHFAQTALYAAMYEETAGEKIDRIKIARTGKTAGDPGDLWSVTDEQREAGRDLGALAVAIYYAKRSVEDSVRVAR